MNGIGRLKRLEKIHADKIDPVYRVMVEKENGSLVYCQLTPNTEANEMDEAQYEIWKEKILRGNNILKEYYFDSRLLREQNERFGKTGET